MSASLSSSVLLPPPAVSSSSSALSRLSQSTILPASSSSASSSSSSLQSSVSSLSSSGRDGSWILTDRGLGLSQSWSASESAALQSTLVFPLFFSNGRQMQPLGEADRGGRLSGRAEGGSSDRRDGGGDEDGDEEDFDAEDEEAFGLPAPGLSPSSSELGSVLHSISLHSAAAEERRALDAELAQYLADLKQNLSSQTELRTCSSVQRGIPPSSSMK